MAEGAYAHLDGQPSAHQAVGHLLLADDSPARTSLCRVLREVGPRCILCPTETDGRNVPGEGGWTPGALGASGRYEAGTRRARVDFMHMSHKPPPASAPTSEREHGGGQGRSVDGDGNVEATRGAGQVTTAVTVRSEGPAGQQGPEAGWRGGERGRPRRVG